MRLEGWVLRAEASFRRRRNLSDFSSLKKGNEKKVRAANAAISQRTPREKDSYHSYEGGIPGI